LYLTIGQTEGHIRFIVLNSNGFDLMDMEVLG